MTGEALCSRQSPSRTYSSSSFKKVSPTDFRRAARPRLGIRSPCSFLQRKRRKRRRPSRAAVLTIIEGHVQTLSGNDEGVPVMTGVIAKSLRYRNATEIAVAAFSAWLLLLRHRGLGGTGRRPAGRNCQDGHHAGKTGDACRICEPEGTVPRRPRSALGPRDRLPAERQEACARFDGHYRLLWRDRREHAQGDSRGLRLAAVGTFPGGDPYAQRPIVSLGGEGPSQ